MGLFSRKTHLDTVEKLLKKALAKAREGQAEADAVRNRAHLSKDYDPSGRTPTISDADAARSDRVQKAANDELAKELRRIADLIESEKIYLLSLKT